MRILMGAAREDSPCLSKWREGSKWKGSMEGRFRKSEEKKGIDADPERVHRGEELKLEGSDCTYILAPANRGKKGSRESGPKEKGKTTFPQYRSIPNLGNLTRSLIRY